MEGKDEKLSVDPFSVLSAIWIFACNDEHPLISYRGIRHRMNLPDDYPVEDIVRQRAELFRLRAPPSQLNAYKQYLRSGKRGPSWLAADARNTEEKLRLIDNLKSSHFFRSQFRTEWGMPRSSLEILKWGLEHIERLRTTSAQEREERHKRVTAVWLPTGSLLVTIVALIVSSSMQWNAARTNANLQIFQTTYEPRQEGYASFMRSMWTSYQVASTSDRARTDSALAALETGLLELEPLLAGNRRAAVWSEYHRFEVFCREVVQRPVAQRVGDLARFTAHRQEMAELLHGGLFAAVPIR